jgi:alpha-L-fucosidase
MTQYEAGWPSVDRHEPGGIPAVGPNAGAAVFTRRDFGGERVPLAVGSYTAAQLKAHDLTPKNIDGIWPADGYRTLAYAGDDLSGASVTLCQPMPDLGLARPVVSLRVTFDPARWFHLVNVASGLVVDGGGVVGSPLRVWAPEDGTTLQFQLVETDGGCYALANRANGCVLDATEPGTLPVQSLYVGVAGQQWSITFDGEVAAIANRATGLLLDGGGPVPSGSPLRQSADDSGPNLRWRFVAVRP